MFTIVADESADFSIIKSLRNKNFEVISILESHSGINDMKVLSIAQLHKCILITEDKDFGELVHRLKMQHFGILLIRLNDLTKEERIELATSVITQYFNKLENNFSVLNRSGLRIKSNLLT